LKSKFKSNKNILILLIITVILFCIFISLNFLNYKFKSNNKNSNINSDKNTNITSNINNELKAQTITESENDENNIQDNSTITIPAIFLYDAPIKEGIDEVTLNNYIGHFPSTSKIDGNIGLAAHNRGYKNNYFMNVNKLQSGDEIIYKVGNIIKKYKVEKMIEIDSYDWSYLNSTNDNRITLITCVDNKPNRRLVVQAVE
jgi:LPXTG-site transpeptidase (sortase) family protein